MPISEPMHRRRTDLASQLRQLPPVNPPARPMMQPQMTKAERLRFTTQRRDYAAGMVKYYDAFIERGHFLEDLYGQTLARISALNGAGIDPSAAAMVALREHTLGQRREFLVELGRFAALARQRQTDDTGGNLIADVVGGAAKAFAATGGSTGGTAELLGAVKGLATFASRGQNDAEAVSAQAVKVGEAADQLRRDMFEYQTAYAQLRTTVQANYPDQDWGFMESKQAAAGP